jgi:hypothetical protein
MLSFSGVATILTKLHGTLLKSKYNEYRQTYILKVGTQGGILCLGPTVITLLSYTHQPISPSASASLRLMETRTK